MAGIGIKKDEIKSTEPSIWGFLSEKENWKGMADNARDLGNDALLVRRGVMQSVAGIPAIPGYLADLVNMGSEKLTGRSYEGSAGKWIQTKVMSGFDAVDPKFLKADIRNAADQKFADNIETAVDVGTAVVTLGAGAVKLVGTGAKLAATTGAKTAAATAARIEPTFEVAQTMTKVAAEATNTITPQAAKATSTAAKDISKLEKAEINPNLWSSKTGRASPEGEKYAAEQAAQKAASKADPLEFTPGMGPKVELPGQAADRIAREAKAAETAAKSADDAKAGFSNAGNGAKAAEETVASGERLGWLRAKRILNDTGLAKGSERSLYDKVRLLHEGGRDDMIPLAIARSRAEGKIASEAGLFRVNNQGLPADLTKRVLDIDSKIAGRGPVANFAEAVSSRVSSFSESARYNISHPGQTMGSIGISAITPKTYVDTVKNLYGAARIGLGLTAADAVGRYALTDDTAYDAGKKSLHDATVAGKLGVEGTAWGLSKIPLIGMPIAGWMLRNVGPGIVSGVKVASQMTDGAMNQAGVEAGLPINEGSHLPKIPGTGVLGSIASMGHNVRNEARSAEQAATETRLEVAKQDLKAAGGAATAAGGAVVDGAKDLMEDFDVKDIEGSMKKMAAKNPALKTILDASEKSPFMKWGVLAGFASGVLGDGSKGEKLFNGIKNAVILGIMFDMVGAWFGHKSLVLTGMGNMINGKPAGSSVNPYTVPLAQQPAAQLQQPVMSAPNTKLAADYVKNLEETSGQKLFKTDAERNAYTQQYADQLNKKSPEQLKQMAEDAQNGVVTRGLNDPLPQGYATPGLKVEDVSPARDGLSAARKLDDAANDPDISNTAFNNKVGAPQPQQVALAGPAPSGHRVFDNYDEKPNHRVFDNYDAPSANDPNYKRKGFELTPSFG